MSDSELPSGGSKRGVFLFRVEDVFAITGRGCVLVPGIPRSFAIPIKRGAPLELRRPDRRFSTHTSTKSRSSNQRPHGKAQQSRSRVI
jgi:hypothetical protein